MDRFREANRRLWDEWAEINLASDFYHVDSFRKDGDLRLDRYEIDEVGSVEGKTLLHLQCHFGLDTLSWARLGARVTGVDFSERAIAAARTLAAEVRLDARFICAEISALPTHLDEQFDVVYTSRGVLGWLPDLAAWAAVVARYVRPGGLFYITEAHPIMWTLDDGGTSELRVAYPYFSRAEPLAFPVQGSYADRNAKVDSPVEYDWPHGLGEIVTSLIDAGLRIDFLHEQPRLAWPQPFLEQDPNEKGYRLRAGQPGELPLMYSLRATKPA